MKIKIAIGVITLFCVLMKSIEGGGFKSNSRPTKKEFGNCLSYGHSCWGAHGKRSGPSGGPLQAIPVLQPNSPSIDQLAERWALVKLMPEKNIRTNPYRNVYPDQRDYDEKITDQQQQFNSKPLTNVDFQTNHISAPNNRLRILRPNMQRAPIFGGSNDYPENDRSMDAGDSVDSDSEFNKNQIWNLMQPNSAPPKYAA